MLSMDGMVRDCLVSARMLTLNNEPHLLTIFRDITERKKVVRALEESEKRFRLIFEANPDPVVLSRLATGEILDVNKAFEEMTGITRLEALGHNSADMGLWEDLGQRDLFLVKLRAMMGYTEFLRSPEEFGGFTQEQKDEFHDIIYEKGEVLSRIVDDLLDISRIESGYPIALDWQDVDLKDLLVKVVNFFRIHSPKHDYKVVLKKLKERTVLKMDHQKITQVMENLISNSIKSSPQGSQITITGEAGLEGCCITVQDRGNGMTSEQVARVFDKFYRADATDTAVSGLGLGMSIAQQIVEAHDGHIWVESTVGKGTLACFTLPVK